MAGDDDLAAGASSRRDLLTRVLAAIWTDDPRVAGHSLSRLVMLRLLGVVYLMAFLTLVNQGRGLIGADGLLPAADYLNDFAAQYVHGRNAAFWVMPTLFWLRVTDGFIVGVGWVGVALSLAVIAGWANALVLAVLCALQISVVAIGQDFYGFGWEIQLVETGFICIFLCPLLDGRPFPRRPTPVIAIWMLRWLAMRIMLGAGLIKWRGDTCWRDFTCLDFHFETQPIPNPITPAFHFLPHWAHWSGVLFNYVAELVAPLLVCCGRRARYVAGALMAALQLVLIASGNLSFLNWLTLVPILACFDDGLWRRLLPRRLVERAERARLTALPSAAQIVTVCLAGALVAVLSVPVVLNLLSGGQMMNTSFTRLPLVNTYGAFGSVGRERDQLVFEGTTDEEITPQTKWQAYEWKCQPSDPARRPCWMSPYHYRLDWLLWFAAMGAPRDYPWAVHLTWKLLEADPTTLGLLRTDPFGGRPPRHIRVDLYRYKLAPRGTPGWWTRERVATWLPPVSRDNEELQIYLRRQGWLGDR